MRLWIDYPASSTAPAASLLIRVFLHNRQTTFGSLLRPGHNPRPSAPPQPRFPDSWLLRAVGPVCSNAREGKTPSLRSWAPCRSRSSFQTTNALTRFEFDDEGTESTGLLPGLPLIVLDGWAGSGAGRCVTGLATTG